MAAQVILVDRLLREIFGLIRGRGDQAGLVPLAGVSLVRHNLVNGLYWDGTPISPTYNLLLHQRTEVHQEVETLIDNIIIAIGRAMGREVDIMIRFDERSSAEDEDRWTLSLQLGGTRGWVELPAPPANPELLIPWVMDARIRPTG